MEAQRPALIVLDALADLFGGDEVNRAQVRQFVAMLRAIAIDFGTTVVLLAHPSVNGMSNGPGLSGSTAWNNSVRSRLYMKRDDQSDPRTIEVIKANYGAVGQQIRVKWERGMFVLLGSVASASEHRQTANHSIDELFLELLADFEAKCTFIYTECLAEARIKPSVAALVTVTTPWPRRSMGSIGCGDPPTRPMAIVRSRRIRHAGPHPLSSHNFSRMASCNPRAVHLCLIIRPHGLTASAWRVIKWPAHQFTSPDAQISRKIKNNVAQRAGKESAGLRFREHSRAVIDADTEGLRNPEGTRHRIAQLPS